MRAVQIALLVFIISALNGPFVSMAAAQSSALAEKAAASFDAKAFDVLRNEGNDSLYNLDYAAARERYVRMTKLAPDHPIDRIVQAFRSMRDKRLGRNR